MGKKKTKRKDATPATDARTAGGWDPQVLEEARELQQQEFEVLQAIFDRDIVRKTSTLLYAYIFSIHLTCESFGTAKTMTAQVILHVDWGKAYPLKQAANVSVELKHGLSDGEVEVLQQELEKLAQDKIGDVMVYDLVTHATEFIQDHLKDQSTFFEQMLQRQKDLESEQKRNDEKLRQRQQAEEQAKNQEIMAIIDAERKRKQDKIKKRSTRRRRRRRRSSADMPDGEGGLDSQSDSGYGTDDDEDEDDDVSGSDLVSSAYGSKRSMERSQEDDGDQGSSSSSFGSDSSDSDMMDSEHTHSRYHSDFKELELLGRGGGGEVVKVRNRLDRQLYAVKKIKLDPEDPTMKKKILREVKTISRMQHRHIVRYFQAWIEGEFGDESESSSDDEDDSEEDDLVEEHVWTRKERRESQSSQDLSGDHDFEGEDDDDWLGTMSNSVGLWSKSKHGRSRGNSAFHSTPFRSSSKHADDGFDWESLEAAPDGFDDDDESSGPRSRHLPRLKVGHREKRRGEKLYIQMECCEGKALREVIDKGALWKDGDKIWTLFRQILEAIVYIHRQGIIHRDIKPPNIFLDAEGTVKLGDFGLAVRPNRLTNDVESEGALTPPSSASAYFANSTGSSAARLYVDMCAEKLESTRMSGPPMMHETTSVPSFIGSDIGAASITAGVGTAFYRAPEQEKEGQRYNHKADMFSLGILFFEMWSPPFTTLMERAQALTCLREKHALPPEFTAPDNVKEIVLWLCNPTPSSRPNADELLASSLLPPKMEVEGTYLQEALQTLANPQGKFFGQMMEALLAQDPVSHVDYTYDHLETMKVRSYVAELRTRRYVKKALQRVFERHGAVEHCTPLLMPRVPENNYTGIRLNTPQNACSMLDAGGVSVTLPFDLTERLARFIARHNIARFKCYQFDRVYRKSLVGGHPRELLESDFDIIWDDRGTFRFLELEGLQVVSEVIALVPSLGSYYVRINDARVTRGILDMGDIPGMARREVLKLLSTEVSCHIHSGLSSTAVHSMKPGRWKYITKKLKEHGINDDQLESLRPFFLVPDGCSAAVDYLESELKKLFTRRLAYFRWKPEDVAADSTNNSKDRPARPLERRHSQKREAQLRRVYKEASEGISALHHLLQGIEFLRMQGPVCLRMDIGLSPRPERYTSGFVFQAVLQGQQTQASVVTNCKTSNNMPSTHVIAEGGRYDSLVTRFKLPVAHAKSTAVAAMGVRFSIDKIVSCVSASLAAANVDTKALTQDMVSTGRSVLICSAGKAGDTAMLRMQLALLLWPNGIGADFLHPEPLHLEDLEEYSALHNIPWMVIVQKHLMREKQQVKIRAVKAPSEPDVVVSCSSLVEFMLELLAKGKSSTALSDVAGTSGRYDGGGGGGGGGSSAHAHQRSGKETGGSSQPVFDVTVLDSKGIPLRDNKNVKNAVDVQKVTRRVFKWVTSSFGYRGGDGMKVLSVDLPFGILRELSTAIMDHGVAGVDDVCAANPRYRKVLKNTADELVSLGTGTSVTRERYVLLHSLSDDRYDLVSLTQATTSKDTSSRRGERSQSNRRGG